MKTIKYIIILFTVCYFSVLTVNGNDKPISFITGVGTSHFEAHRMAINAANAAGLRIKQQISQKSGDRLWHVIITVSPE